MLLLNAWKIQGKAKRLVRLFGKNVDTANVAERLDLGAVLLNLSVM
jgi:hypothetical protein